MSVVLPPMTRAQTEAWSALLDLSAHHPTGWTLVGGQMVHGVSGGTTIETPGAQQALDRTERVDVILGDRSGSVRRPNLLGALVAKAAAHSVVRDRVRARHLIDFAVLTTLIRPSDAVNEAGRRDRSYLEALIGAMTADRRTWAGVEGADDGLARLRLALSPPPRRSPR